MEKNTPIFDAYFAKIEKHLAGNSRLVELFKDMPKLSIDVFKQTASFFANKRYEEHILQKGTVIQGFYTVLENSIKDNGVLKTIRLYEMQLGLISEIMDISTEEINKLLMKLRFLNSQDQIKQTEAQAASQLLRQIIRKFNAKYKEKFIKDIINAKNEELKESIVIKPITPLVRILPADAFLSTVLGNNTLRKRIGNVISEKFGISVNDEMISKIITSTVKKTYTADYCEALGLCEPLYYDDFLQERSIKRLQKNYIPKLNKTFKNATPDELELVLKVLNHKIKCKKERISPNNDEYEKIRPLIKQLDMNLLEEISSILAKIKAQIILENGQFVLKVEKVLSKAEYAACYKYNEQLDKVKSLHNTLFCFYKNQLEIISTFMDETSKFGLEEETNEVDPEKWLDSSKIIELLKLIDLVDLEKLSVNAFKALKKFMIKDGLLWAYLAGNIDIETIAKIINNFKTIYINFQGKDLAITNLPEIIKNSNLYEYADNLAIGLIGAENLTKIINYNQFAGVKVTKEEILLRIRKAVDLAVRSERVTKSSLPFDFFVEDQEYLLSRYYNNDSELLTCGVDTKTCFFISANENDCVFYSHLNKNGFVIKITDHEGRMIARATCFRKNNCLMINAIKLVNNKILPDNKEDLLTFIKIVNLVEEMAIKIIALTSTDDCPIDYVVCNKSGILENDYFANRFETINGQLFREPLNIYGEDWQEFCNLYKGESEDLLQEASKNPNNSFTTDFGDHYPTILISSRNNMGLTSPRDISLNDQSAIYERPRETVQVLDNWEISDEVIAKLNRIRALECFSGTEEEQKIKKQNYNLIKSINRVKKLIISDDWFIVILLHDKLIGSFANISKANLEEARRSLETLGYDKSEVMISSNQSNLQLLKVQ